MSIIYRQILSEIIDLAICLIPALLIFFYAEYNFEPFNVIHILAIIFLFYFIVSIIIFNGQSIGDRLLKIIQINTKNNKRSKAKFFLRSLFKSLAIFLLADFDQVSIIQIFIIIMLLAPIKIGQKNIFIFRY